MKLKDNKNTIKLLCQFCKISYEEYNIIKKKYKEINNEKEQEEIYQCLKLCNKCPVYIDSKEGCQLYITVYNTENIICIFRGSDDVRDWISNLDTELTNMDISENLSVNLSENVNLNNLIYDHTINSYYNIISSKL